MLRFFEGNSVIKKYVLFVSFSALTASVALARLNSADDPNLRAGGASTPSFADQVANFVAIAAALNSGGPGTTSLDPATSKVAEDNSQLQLSGNSKPSLDDDAAGDTDNTEI
jgi:Co/Zn/Cd efflux system component